MLLQKQTHLQLLSKDVFVRCLLILLVLTCSFVDAAEMWVGVYSMCANKSGTQMHHKFKINADWAEKYKCDAQMIELVEIKIGIPPYEVTR